MAVSSADRTVPKKWPEHHPYDESVDEPAKLLEQEATEIEKEIPADDAEPIEQVERPEGQAPFEE